MNKTSIEWCDYSINPIKGICPVDCKDNQGKSYCYARRMYKRFKWNPEIRFDFDVYDDVSKLRKPSRIFVGSTMELFGSWIKEDWLDRILGQASLIYPQHTFIFLTKQPQNLIKWSPFPDNCWVGVSVTNGKMVDDAGYYLEQIKANIKFLSIEPLLEPIKLYFGKPGIDWVIIGQQTPIKLETMPQVGWVDEIIEATDRANIPVFLKDNLISCVDQYDFALDKEGKLRQEFPVVPPTTEE